MSRHNPHKGFQSSFAHFPDLLEPDSGAHSVHARFVSETLNPSASTPSNPDLSQGHNQPSSRSPVLTEECHDAGSSRLLRLFNTPASQQQTSSHAQAQQAVQDAGVQRGLAFLNSVYEKRHAPVVAPTPEEEQTHDMQQVPSNTVVPEIIDPQSLLEDFPTGRAYQSGMPRLSSQSREPIYNEALGLPALSVGDRDGDAHSVDLSEKTDTTVIHSTLAKASPLPRKRIRLLRRSKKDAAQVACDEQICEKEDSPAHDYVSKTVETLKCEALYPACDTPVVECVSEASVSENSDVDIVDAVLTPPVDDARDEVQKLACAVATEGSVEEKSSACTHAELGSAPDDRLSVILASSEIVPVCDHDLKALSSTCALNAGAQENIEPVTVKKRLLTGDTAAPTLQALVADYQSKMRDDDLLVSVVMPCLNEAETLAHCIERAQYFIKNSGARGEVVIADNGSTDGSVGIAYAHGARVVHVQDKGYGAALMGGIRKALGRFVIMADCDMSYDFAQGDRILYRLLQGAQLVMGNRFKGGIRDGAMPWKNRYIGNPVLSVIGRVLYDVKVKDFHCGLRGFHRKDVLSLSLNSPGMEFASEMVCKAAKAGLHIEEVPVTLSPDGRSRPPHLKPWRDGWRHLKFLMTHAPDKIFYTGGAVFLSISTVALSALILINALQLGTATHKLVFCLAIGALIVGIQYIIYHKITANVYRNDRKLSIRNRKYLQLPVSDGSVNTLCFSGFATMAAAGLLSVLSVGLSVITPPDFLGVGYPLIGSFAVFGLLGCLGALLLGTGLFVNLLMQTTYSTLKDEEVRDLAPVAKARYHSVKRSQRSQHPEPAEAQ